MNEFIFFKPALTWISRSLILVPCWRSRLLSSFSSFCTNSAVALFFWVRRVAQIALYSNVLSSLGFPVGLFISPTRTPRSVFCSRTNRREQNLKKCHSLRFTPRVLMTLKFQVKAFFCSACSTAKNHFKWLIKTNASYTSSHSIYLSCSERVYFILEASVYFWESTTAERMEKRRGKFLTICLRAPSKSFLPESFSKSPTIHTVTALIPSSSMKHRL